MSSQINSQFGNQLTVYIQVSSPYRFYIISVMLAYAGRRHRQKAAPTVALAWMSIGYLPFLSAPLIYGSAIASQSLPCIA